MAKFSILLSLAVLAIQAAGMPQPNSYQSLAGLSEREIQSLIPRLNVIPTPPPPPPITDTAVKLVNDAAHPYIAPTSEDMRGPCPGLNTLANHGYLPRNGIATPAQLLNAVQEGFSMDYETASILVFSTMIVDGNPLTNLMSIGGKSSLTGADPPKPAIVGGLDTHGVFEGDASMTREDFFFGDNHDFNATLFAQFTEFSNKFGAGTYNLTTAGELRFQRIQQSIGDNPTFSFVSPRFTTAYGESAFPTIFFVDGRKSDFTLPIADALGFFRDGRMPNDFHRADGSQTADMLGTAINFIFNAHPTQPGKNNGTINSFTIDPTAPNLNEPCGLYSNFVENVFGPLYPNPTGILRDNLNVNLNALFGPFASDNCTQLFPFGK